MTPLNKAKLKLEGKLNQVRQRMSRLEKSITDKQRIIDDKSSLLKATEMIESDGDVVELIRLRLSFIPALHLQNVKNGAVKLPQVFVLYLSQSTCRSYSIHEMQ